MFAKWYVKTLCLLDDEGATALEYGILVAMIALVIMAGVTVYGSRLNSFFQTLSARVPR